MFILGIESSCDDSSSSIIDSNGKILSNVIISQSEEHREYGGVVPEIASRAHLNNVEIAIKKALNESKITLSQIDAIAVTAGPGLIGSLLVGIMYGKALASVLKKPIISVNHLEGHILSPQLSNQIPFPYLLLLISGGHSQFIATLGLQKYIILGQTLDDALGEAFDKVAKMLGLGFPGGVHIERQASLGNEDRFSFPKPLILTNDCNLSFSGLKTAVRNKIKTLSPRSEQDIKDISASFQKTVSSILCKKTEIAIKLFEQLTKKINIPLKEKYFALAGGVASNLYLREKLKSTIKEQKYQFISPQKSLCTDNAAMIAFAGLKRFKLDIIDDINFLPNARWNIENC